MTEVMTTESAEIVEQMAPDALMFKPLEELEDILENRARGYVVDGLVLKAIRDGQATSGRRGKFRDSGYPTFDDYCKTEWNFRKDNANQLIITAGAMYEMASRLTATRRQKLPLFYAHARSLARVKDVDIRLRVWIDLLDRIEREGRLFRSITEAEVREAVMAVGAIEEQPKELRRYSSPEEKLVNEFLDMPAWFGRTKADPEKAAIYATETLRAEELEVQASVGRDFIDKVEVYVSNLESAIKTR